MDVVARVRDTIARHELASPATRVLVAVSGGSDSVALAHVLRELDAARELTVAGLAHFNHQLRESAGRDEAFVADLAHRLGWPLQSGRGDVAALARREHRSIEDAARTARHAFLEQARIECGADLVAVGHTRDDQAETFLLRLIRGAGPRGLAAMHPRSDRVIRPLLACRREELRAYLAGLGAGFVEDESNADLSIPRNRVRAELLPMLVRFNPAIVDVLADEADLAREEWHWLESEAARLAEALGRPVPEGWALDAAGLRAAPLPLRRHAIWRLMRERAGGRPVGFKHVEAALGLLVRADASLDAPGHRLERIGSRLVLRHGPRPVVNLFDYPLSIPGMVDIPEAGLRVSAELADRSTPAWTGLTGRVGMVRHDLCRGPLVVRNRRPGDRFRPVGLEGRKKLQDYFVDRKVARAERDAVPIVVDGAGRIVWVAGHGIDAAFRVTDASQGVLIFKLRELGGSA
jgi:tRNA(Ile)-lysidine synthase